MSGWEGTPPFEEGCFAVIEADGHNYPSIWVFRSQAACERYLRGDGNFYDWETPIDVGYFDEESEYEDGNGVVWSTCPTPEGKQSLYVHDARDKQ